MRVDGNPFQTANQSEIKDPRFVIEWSWDTANTDLHYITSHPGTEVPSGATVIQDVIKSLSVTSQTLDPLNGRATIGDISFTVNDVDNAVTTVINTKLAAGDGLRHKRVRVYVGAPDLVWADYQLIQTQLIDDAEIKDSVYTFECTDIQRSTKKDIFDAPITHIGAQLAAPNITALTATLALGATTAAVDSTTDWASTGYFIVESEIIRYTGTTSTTFTGLIRAQFSTVDVAHSSDAVVTQVMDDITVINSDDFETTFHGASYTDAPNTSAVGYIKIDDEVIRYYSKASSTTFSFCVRGVLNTAAVAHDWNASAASDRNPIVTSYPYYELPILKMGYAILTGDLYGDAATIASYDHLSIDTTFVATSKFIQHTDLYDTSDDTLGFVIKLEGMGKQDAKSFLQKEIYRLAGGYSPVLSDGQLSFERMTGVLSDAHYVAVLDDTNVKSYGMLKHSMKKVFNKIRIKWNWEERFKKYTRSNKVTDAVSIAKHQDADLFDMSFRGLHGSIHTESALNQKFDALRDRHAGPPLEISLVCLNRMNYLEVGDVVRVTLDNVRDWNNSTISLDRSFEIQGMTTDWSGLVTLQLFGSSQKAGAISSDTSGTDLLDDAYYPSVGTDLATNPGGITTTLTAGVLHIDGGGTLTGNADMTASGAIYYVDTPFQLDAGVTVVCTENVQIRHQGHAQINGKFDLKGQGLAGGAAHANHWEFTAGTAGFIGATESAGNIAQIGYDDGFGGFNYHTHQDTYKGLTTIGTYPSAPTLELVNNSTSIAGIPTDFRGTSGSSGGGIYIDGFNVQYNNTAGGAGGAGGGSILFVGRGVSFGVNGDVDISGGDGGTGGTAEFNTQLGGITGHYWLTSGSGGGGAPGVAYFVVDGSASTVGSIQVTANQGKTPILSGEPLPEWHNLKTDGSWYPMHVSNGNEATPKTNSSFVVQYLPSNTAAEADLPEFTSKPVKITLAEVTNTPESISGNFSSIEITVTEPPDTNYASTNLYGKLSANTEYKPLGSADQESVQQAVMDGSTYDFRAYGVSLAGLETDNYVEKSITVSTAAGGATLGTGNYIASGQTAHDTGVGFYLSNVGGVPKFSIGNSSGNKLTWDGSLLKVVGSLEVGSSAGGWAITATQIHSTNIWLDSSAKAISINDQTFSNAGIQMQYNSGTPRMYVGDGSTKFFNFDGTNLTLGAGTIKEFTFEMYTSGVIQTDSDPATNGGLRMQYNGFDGWDGSGNHTIDINTDGTFVFGDKTNTEQYIEFDGSNYLLGRDVIQNNTNALNSDVIFINSVLSNNIASSVLGSGWVRTDSTASRSFANSSASINSEALDTINRDLDLTAPSWDKYRHYEVRVTSPSGGTNRMVSTAVTGRYTNATKTTRHFGFYFDTDGSVYATWANGTTQYTQVLQAFSANVKYTLRAVLDSGTDINFYVDNVLKHTANTTAQHPSGTSDASYLQTLSFYKTSVSTTSAFVGEIKIYQSS